MGYGDARVRGNPERWKLPRRDEPSNSLPLSVFVFSILVFSILLSSPPVQLSLLLLCLSLSLSLSLPSSLSISLIPSSSFSSFPLPPALFRRLNQPAEETTRRGGGEGSRRGRRGRSEKDRREGERERAVDEHKHGILSDVDVYVNAEYLMGCQKQSL